MTRKIPISLLLLCLLARAAHADDALLTGVPPDTLQLYQRFQQNYKNPKSDAALLAALEAAPGGDVCLLDAAFQTEANPARDAGEAAVATQKTERVFALLKRELDGPESTRRTVAIELLQAFHRAELIPQLLTILKNDSSEFPRDAAVIALADFDDARIAPALLAVVNDPVPMIGNHALAGLARMKSKKAFPMIVARLKTATDGDRDICISNVAAYHDPAAVAVLLAELQRTEGLPDVWSRRWHDWTHWRLRDCLAAAKPLLGPYPDPYFREWADYWDRAQPLLTEDLQLKQKPPVKLAVTYAPQDFAATTEAITLAASVGAAEFRTGDPIRLQLTLSNGGKKPASLVMPGLPSGWMPTMAYGIHLERDGKVLLNLAPSSFYQGSYSGPPRFETLDPGDKFESSTCLQQWLGHRVDLPLGEGAYELTIIFDSRKFAGIRPTGVQLAGQWQAPPIKFTVKGPARTAPDEVVQAIGALTRQPFLLADLTSNNSERHEAAWRTLMVYADSRLAPLLKKIETDQPDRAFPYLKAESLPPFELPAAPRLDRQP